MRRVVLWMVVGCVGVLLVPSTASAQASISGLVQDATGGVLPGVTVEAASPVLIEQVRSVVTDGAGRYTIVDLRPGTYTVTFSLPGFSAVKREGIVLEGAFNANVNAELRIGTLEETVTVSGASPVVDVQSVRREFVVNREMLDVLPGGRSLTGRVNLIPGVTNNPTGGGFLPTIHGSPASETYMYNDGMRAGQHLSGNGTSQGGWAMNEAASAELSYGTGAQSAEMQVSGVAMNAIPKEGGNVFSGTFVTYGAGGGVQSDNLTPELKLVIRDPDRLAYTYEVNPAFGGPLRKDKLWFFAGLGISRSKTYVADLYLRDGSQAFKTGFPYSELLRLTSQLTPRNKLRVSFDKRASLSRSASIGPGVLGSASAGATQPEAGYNIHIPQVYAPQGKWTSPVTSRLLLEAGLSTHYMSWRHQYQPEVGPLDIAHSEQTTGGLSVATTSRATNTSNHFNAIASISYVTGSHALKTGVVHRWGFMEGTSPYNGDIQLLSFLGGQPTSVTVLNTPRAERDNMNADLGVYAQDAWTVDRFTFNLGARYDYFNASIPEQSAPAGRFVPARRFAAIENQPNFKDWAVRLGVAYDLFGTGKTALKANASKYVGGTSMEFTSPYNPMGLKTEQRSWRDLDGNGSPLDANGNAQYDEIGPTRNVNFGVAGGTTRLDPNLPRDYNWEESVLIQHELRPGVAVTAGYYRRQFYNVQWTDNLLVDPDRDYTPFTITAPRDPRLPNGGGEVITMYNLNREKLGLVDNLVTASAKNRTVYNGVEVTADARFPNGAFLFGGVTTDRTEANTCEVDNPNSRRFCDRVSPFRTMVKMSGAYPLPYDLQVSGTWWALPGGSLGATYAVNSAIAGVPLTGGGSLNVQLVQPNTLFEDYWRQLDLRLMRIFRIGRVQTQALLDIYNVLNASTTTTITQTYGRNWLRPLSILQGRYLRFGAQIDF